MARLSWLDSEKQTPIIDHYAQQLSAFVEAMQDGKVDEGEVRGQEHRVVELMKQIEPQLNDEQHAEITKLLCELTAYNIMQIMHVMDNARKSHTEFRG